MNTEDLIKLKEDIFKEIRSRESSIQEKTLLKVLAVEEINTDLVSQINKINNTIKNISETVMNQKIKNQKLDEFVGFKNKIESFSLTHEIRINSILDDISKIRTKYDKIIADNIFVPGLIGPSCQYKSLGDFTSSQINLSAKTKSEREQMKKDFKDYKTKVDTFIKNVVSLIDSSVIRSNEYAENRVRHVKEFVEMKIYEFDKIFTDSKNEIIEKQNKINEDLENAKNDLNQISIYKSGLDDLLKNKTEDFNKLEIELKTTTENYLKEFYKIKTHLEKENKNIKDSLKEAFRMIGEIRRKVLSNIDIISKIENDNNFIMNEMEKVGKQHLITKQLIVYESPKKYHQTIIKNLNNKNSPELSERKIEKQMIVNNEKEKINKFDLNENLIDENSKINFNEKETINVDKTNIDIKKSKDEELYKKLNSNNQISISSDNSRSFKQIDNNNINSNEEKKKKTIKPFKISNKLLEAKSNNVINKNNLYKYYNLKKQLIKKNSFNKKNIVNDNKLKTNDHKFNTIDNHISHSSKIFGLKTYTNGFYNKKRKKLNNFKVISLDKKLVKNVNEVYTMTSAELVKKRSIKIDFSSSFKNLIKKYSKNKNQQNELQLAIKVSPAFGSTAYSVCDPISSNIRSSVKNNKLKENKISRNFEMDDIENYTSSNYY